MTALKPRVPWPAGSINGRDPLKPARLVSTSVSGVVSRTTVKHCQVCVAFEGRAAQPDGDEVGPVGRRRNPEVGGSQGLPTGVGSVGVVDEHGDVRRAAPKDAQLNRHGRGIDVLVGHGEGKRDFVRVGALEIFRQVGHAVIVIVAIRRNARDPEVVQLPPEWQGGGGALVAGLGADEKAIGSERNAQGEGVASPGPPCRLPSTSHAQLVG